MTTLEDQPTGERAQALAEPVAIVGMACRVPGSPDLATFWRNLSGGVESVRYYSREEQLAAGVPEYEVDDPHWVPAASSLENIEYFDAGFFDMTPREAELRDPQQRLFLELAYTALQDGGYDPARFDGEIGVYGGLGADEYQWKNIRLNPKVMASTGLLSLLIGNHSDYLATFTSYKLNLRGPSLTVHTACSTSLVALHLATEAVRNGECDMALTGAMSLELPHHWGYMYAEGGIVSPDGHCRPFEAKANGTIWGSGGGLLLLKRLDRALADGDHIRAVILGDAINNDGAEKVGFSAPSVEGQAAVVAQALGVAGVDPRTISYVEAHGTATALGDPIEVTALSDVFGRDSEDTGWCGLGSVKSNIGHLGPAAGVVAMIKTVLAMEHRRIPPSLHFETPHPKLNLEASPFYVNATLSTWDGQVPLRAGVSSFGIGGTNAHVVVEQAPEVQPAPASTEPVLLQLSARSENALASMTDQLAGHLTENGGVNLADVSYTLRYGRPTFAHRATVVARDAADAAAGLRDRKRLAVGRAAGTPPRVAFLFSGQGAQFAGMGAELYTAEPVFRDHVDECVDLLRGELGLDLRDLMFATGEERAAADKQLTRTALTQPALFTVEYALARLWQSWGVEPDAMIGHSIGEYVAATLAGVFAPADAVGLVAARGALMQSLPAGSMLAVQMDEAEVRDILPAGVAIATVNGPGTCVVSGASDAVNDFAGSLAEQGVGSKRLRTSHAFHSHMMDPILAEFRERVASVPRHAPAMGFLSNLTGDWITAEDAADPTYWTRHLREAVRFGDCVATLLAAGQWTMVEVGPGRQAAGLARMQIPREAPAPLQSLPGPSDRAGDLVTLYGAAGRLWTVGGQVRLDGDEQPAFRRVPLPTYPFERKYHWIEPLVSSPADVEPDRMLPLDEWFAVPGWRQAAALAPATAPQRFLVLGDGPRAADVVTRLRSAGDEVEVVRLGGGYAHDGTEYVVSTDRADYDLLVADLAGSGGLPTRIVHAFALDGEAAGSDSAAAWRAQDHGFFSVLNLAQALAAVESPGPVHLDVLTVGTCDVLGGELTRPEHATLAGPVKVLPLELPWLTARQVDVGHVEDLAAAAVELRRDPGSTPDAIVALRNGRRWIQDFDQVPVPGGDDATAGLREGGVYVITGGTGGIGITVAEDLARRVRAKLVLVARTALPGRDEWDSHLAVHGPRDRGGRAITAIRRMEEAGAEVLVVAADVTCAEEMRHVRDQAVQRFGRIDVLVHAAGVAGGGMAEVKERATAESVLAPKILGTLALREAFGDLPLDAVVLCSSVTAVAGGFGQVDYCGANAFMDALAHADHGFAGRVVSLNWAGWLEVGMAAEIAAPDALRALQRGVVTTPVDHPLISMTHHDPTTDAVSGSGLLSPATHWVLDEHRINGTAVLPGTGQLEGVRAAAAAGLPGAGGGLVELSDVVFMQPMAVPDDGQAAIRVAFAPGADGAGTAEFQVTSRREGEEQVHVRGGVTVAPGGAAPVHDMAGVLARCTVGTVEAGSTTSHSGMLSFGPHWASLRRVHVGVNEELGWFEAPEQVRSELGHWVLHPALLDEATSFGTSRGEGNYLPMGYGKVLVRGPLPARMWSHLRYREGGEETIVADLTLSAEDGTEVVAISEFMLRRVDPDTVTQQMGTAARVDAVVPADSREAIGISPTDGAEALRRMLANDLGPQLTVTVNSIQRVIAGVRAVTQEAVAGELVEADAGGDRGTLETDYLAPRTDLERTLCELWQSQLGIGRVGVNDDFFDLGGNSLVAVQLIAQARKAIGEKLPMRTLFEAPTVAGMAASIERLRAERGAH